MPASNANLDLLGLRKRPSFFNRHFSFILQQALLHSLLFAVCCEICALFRRHSCAHVNLDRIQEFYDTLIFHMAHSKTAAWLAVLMVLLSVAAATWPG
jgi:hypothetical protein